MIKEERTLIMFHGNAEHYFNELRKTGVCLIGLGVSHRDLLALLIEKKIPVTVCDRSQSLEGQKELEEKGVLFHTGEDYLKHLDAPVIFRSPGLYFYTPELTKARRAGKIVTSEMEMFFSLCPCKIYGITGSDGKTTTSSLIAEMLKKSGKVVHLGGNIGRPLLPIIESIQPEDVAVVELSSFQLLSMRVSPDVAVITNIAPNHLDVHESMEEYVEAKKHIFWHQQGGSKTILNLDNAYTSSFENEVRDEAIFFSRLDTPLKGTFRDKSGSLIMKMEKEEIPLFHERIIRIPGVHNVENYLAACAALYGDISVEIMREVAETFPGVEHRIEFVCEKKGVRFYNDAIATSPTRTMAGLRSFSEKVILIAGGYDKKIPYDKFGELVCQKVKTIVLSGQTADKIEEAIRKAETKEKPVIYRENSFDEAVFQAEKIAENGDVVLFSPASASFDEFKNFEVKGNHFKELVGREKE